MPFRMIRRDPIHLRYFLMAETRQFEIAVMPAKTVLCFQGVNSRIGSRPEFESGEEINLKEDLGQSGSVPVRNKTSRKLSGQPIRGNSPAGPGSSPSKRHLRK